MNINWALPVVWPGAVYGLEIGIVGTEGVIDIEDTHRDVIIASRACASRPATTAAGSRPRPRATSTSSAATRRATSPTGCCGARCVRRPCPGSTGSRSGVPTPHATAAEGHRNLLLTMAMDLSAKRGVPVSLPITPEELREGLREDRIMTPEKPLSVGIIGTGWCGGIRAIACANSALVAELHLAETDPDRLARDRRAHQPDVARPTTGRSWSPTTASTRSWSRRRRRTCTSRWPGRRSRPASTCCWRSRSRSRLDEADELIGLAEDRRSEVHHRLLAAVQRQAGHGEAGDQRRHPRRRVSSILVSRHITRSLGAKISSRTKLSPAAMEATHDLDFAFWCLEPRRPVRVYSQNAWGVRARHARRARHPVHRRHHGRRHGRHRRRRHVACRPATPTSRRPGSRCSAPRAPSSSTPATATSCVNTVEKGVQFPLSTMPGEYVDHVYAGPMERETTHFLEAVAYDRPVMVDPHLARDDDGGLPRRRPVGRDQRGRDACRSPRTRSGSPSPSCTSTVRCAGSPDAARLRRSGRAAPRCPPAPADSPRR